MKKLLLYIFLIAFSLTSCEDWLDVNTDPNTPSEVPNELILPAAEVSIATRLGGNIFNFTGIFAQYWTQAPEANQYNKIDNYDLTAPFLNRDYIELFAGALNDLEMVRTQATEEENTAYFFVATVLRAYTYQMWVDLMNDVPYTEALQGVDNKFPAYDSGQDIYAGIITEINDAMAALEEGDMVGESDYLFGGNINEWVKFANSLKLKIYMRASYANDYSSEIQALINEGNFITSDVAFSAWEAQDFRYNPWYGTNKIGLGTVNNIAASPIVSYLNSNGDPRLPLLWTDVNGDFVGGVPAMKEDYTEDFSHPIIGETQPVYFMTMTELELFKSEAYVRFYNDDAKAQQAYNNAIDYNLAIHGLSNGQDLYGDGKVYAWPADGDTEDKIKSIAMQKWVSLCLVNNLEAWNEMRRLGYPEYNGAIADDVYDGGAYTAGNLISPSGNALGEGNFIQRLLYPEESTRLNNNAPEQKDLTTPIWWDKK
jgi:hypothetical protein